MVIWFYNSLNVLSKRIGEMQKKDTMPASIIRFFSLSKNFLSVYKRYFSYRYYLIFERRLEKRNKLPLTLKVPNANLFIIDAPTEVDKLISSGYDLSPCHHFSRLKDKLNKGAVLFVVFIGKEFAHSCWVAMNNNPAICDHLFQRIFYRGVYIGPAQTIEPYRGKGIFPYVLSKICEFIFKKGETNS